MAVQSLSMNPIMVFGIKITLFSLTTVLIFPETSIAALISKPTDTDVLVKDSTYFNCSTSVVSEDIQWFHFPFPVGSTTGRKFVYGYGHFYDPYIGRFSIETYEVRGTFNLFISSAQIEDAGVYECQDDVGRGDKASARLIVLDQGLVCQSNHETNKVIGPNQCNIPAGDLQLTCSTTYHGDVAPVLKWFQDGSNQSLAEGVTFLSSGNRSLSNLTLKAGSIEDGSSFHCRTTRSKPTPYNCTSGPIQVVGTVSSAVTICSDTKPYVAAIVVTWILLIPIIIVASAVLGIFCLIRRPLKILDRPLNKLTRKVARKNKELPDEEKNLTSEKTDEGVLVPDIVDIPLEEPESENNEITTKEKSEQNEKLMQKIHELNKRVKQKDKEVLDLQNKNKQLQIEKSELEGRLYPAATTSYAVPKLVTEIVIKDLKLDSKKETRPIFGMTILRDKLYVVTEESSEIIVYDSVTFNAEANWSIPEMSRPLDIASCSTNNCLYTVSGSADGMFVFRVDSGKSILKKWPIAEDECHLSVGRNLNVIVNFFNGNKIIEYSPQGVEIMIVRLSPADNISHPWHAIKTSSMHFIFSHGFGEDPLQRVCVASATGQIMKSFGGKKGSDKEQMNRPVHLLEDSSRNILVADMKNKRVLLLSPTLELKKCLVSSDKLRFPMRLCLDEERGILFVADNNYKEKKGTYDSGRILIFNCKK